MNKESLQKQFVKDLNTYLSKNKDVINAVKALEVLNYLTIQSNSIFDYVYKWHSLEYPELYGSCSKDNSKYIKAVLESNKKDSIMFGSIGPDAIGAIKSLCNLFLDFEKNSKKLRTIIEKSAKTAYPNISTLLGPILATKFISQVGSLERLSKMPSSSLQLIGAESALFKHLKFGKKCPKYGFLYLHPIMQGLSNKQKGKLSRYFAGRIELAVRADMYTKNDISESLLKDLEKKKVEIKNSKWFNMIQNIKNRIYTETKDNYNHYGEKVIKQRDLYLREWSPNNSKIAAAMKKGFNLKLKDNSNVLYVGCSSGTTLSHIADLVTKGDIVANDVSMESMVGLLSLLKIKKNIIPILSDFRVLPENTGLNKEKFDFVFQDVSQKDQADVFIELVKKFLNKGGQAAISLKTRSIDSSKSPKQVLVKESEKIRKAGLKILKTIDLEPFEKEHYFLEISF